MRTQLLGSVALHEDKILAELANSAEFRYSEPYGEFLSGRSWKTCMLWSAAGEVGDGVLSHYDPDRPAMATAYGEALPYLRSVIERSFSTRHLTYARLAVMSECVIFPHRDFVELTDVPETNRAAHRLHIPLVTHDDALFTEDNLVFRMGLGEVWFLDVTQVHSAAVLSENRRVHLILDFADADRDQLVSFPTHTAPGVPDHAQVNRPPLGDHERAELLSLASVVDLDNLTEVFGIVIKKHYRHDGGANFVWDTMAEIGRRSGDTAVAGRIGELHEHCVSNRAQ